MKARTDLKGENPNGEKKNRYRYRTHKTINTDESTPPLASITLTVRPGLLQSRYSYKPLSEITSLDKTDFSMETSLNDYLPSRRERG